jgi:ATP-binding cassette, subfamily C, bacterial
VITLGRLLDATRVPAGPERPYQTSSGPDVVVRDVTFAYGPHAEPVVRNLDLTIAPGEHLAVVGPSGIGKSTVVSLVCGLRRPDHGEVTLGGVPAAELSPAALAAARVLIPQEAYVFTGTLRDNLTYLNPDATTAELDAAATAIGAELGDYDAEIRPQDMSAGERQLVALVRAYLSPAPLVVLDEATCHLDPAAERRAELAFAHRPGTLVVIAHRISSALRADRVLVLDGAGATVGDHGALLRTSSLYRDLLGHWEAGRTPSSQPA